MIDADVIDALADGLIDGPIAFLGSTFFRMRVSGTGCAWREKQKEFCFRDPRLWLTEDMTKRWAGAPLIWQHPATGVLDGSELSGRVVGTIVKAFVAGDELMGIARVINETAANLLAENGGDTSPAVIFEKGETEPIVLPTGERILIEREPKLIDHLAICQLGVWSKGSDAQGVEKGD